MIFVYQAGVQIRRVIPDTSQLGATYLALLIRDLAASICALLLATRVGAGIAAEIGSMVVTEQIDALRMCAADPVEYLVRPRLLASLVMTPVLTVIAGSVAFGTGHVDRVRVLRDQSAHVRRCQSGGRRATSSSGSTKCVAYGAAIPIISAHAGLSTRRLRRRRLGDDPRRRRVLARDHRDELRHQRGGLRDLRLIRHCALSRNGLARCEFCFLGASRPPQLASRLLPPVLASLGSVSRLEQARRYVPGYETYASVVAAAGRCLAALASTTHSSSPPHPCLGGSKSAVRRRAPTPAPRTRPLPEARSPADTGRTGNRRTSRCRSPVPPCNIPRGKRSRFGTTSGSTGGSDPRV